MKIRWLWKICPCRGCYTRRRIREFDKVLKKDMEETIGPPTDLYYRDLKTGEPRDTNPNPQYFLEQRIAHLKQANELKDLELEMMMKSPMLFVQDGANIPDLQLEPGQVFRSETPGFSIRETPKIGDFTRYELDISDVSRLCVSEDELRRDLADWILQGNP